MECLEVANHFVGINVTQHEIMVFQDFLIELPVKGTTRRVNRSKKGVRADWRVLIAEATLFDGSFYKSKTIVFLDC
jgi:hypothetical protein